MNTVAFAGNLAAAPEMRFTTSGKPVANLRVLENRRRRDAEGNWADDTPNAFDVRVWGAAAEHVTQTCVKGSRVVVVGSLSTQEWEHEGQTHRRQIVTADEVGVSLKFAPAQILQSERRQESQPPAGPAPQDPWATSTPPAHHTAAPSNRPAGPPQQAPQQTAAPQQPAPQPPAAPVGPSQQDIPPF